MPDHVLAQRLKEQTIMRAVPDLLKSAVEIAGKTSDNATALAVMWQGSTDLDELTAISTHTLPIGEVQTTIQDVSTQPGSMENFDDDEIEKAIAEIRGAINKSNQL
jgi:protein phosphatase